jgi:hypothetical protein
MAARLTTASGQQRKSQARAFRLESATLPLCSEPYARPFWIMLVLVSGTTDHGIIVSDEP